MSQLGYWDSQFKKNKLIWGDKPTNSVNLALRLFSEHSVKRLLIPGVGYGRNSKPFTLSDLDLTGIEISSTACEIAKHHDPLLNVVNSSLFDIDSSEPKFDAIFCYDVLHLFLESERSRFIAKCSELITNNGVMFFTVLSEKDSYFGKGKEVEHNTFEVKEGKVIHFFTEQDLQTSFADFVFLEAGEIVDTVVHSEHGDKQYNIRYVCVKNKDVTWE